MLHTYFTAAYLSSVTARISSQENGSQPTSRAAATSSSRRTYSSCDASNAASLPVSDSPRSPALYYPYLAGDQGSVCRWRWHKRSAETAGGPRGECYIPRRAEREYAPG